MTEESPDIKYFNDMLESGIVPVQDFSDLEPGQTVQRVLAGVIKMPVVVDRIEGDRVIMVGGWEFDRATGVEEDEDIGFGVKFGMTGSYLVRE